MSDVSAARHAPTSFSRIPGPELASVVFGQFISVAVPLLVFFSLQSTRQGILFVRVNLQHFSCYEVL